MPRPVEKYSAGLHHVAQPTLDPRATLEFYVDVMGAKITYCISSKGWRPGHLEYTRRPGALNLIGDHDAAMA